MRHKFPVIENSDRCEVVVPADGSRYRYATEAEKKVAWQQANEHCWALQNAIESKLGRPLTPEEARRGLAKQDDRAVLQRIEDHRRWEAIFAPPKPSEEANPYTIARLRREEDAERERDPAGYGLKQKEKEFAAEQVAKQRMQALASDPRRQRGTRRAELAVSTQIRFAQFVRRFGECQQPPPRRARRRLGILRGRDGHTY